MAESKDRSEVLAESDDTRVVRADGRVLKVPRTPAGRDMIRREAAILAATHAPHFVKVIQGVSGPVLVMRDAGETLFARVVRDDGGAFTATEALDWLRGGLRALRGLHECGVAHGDVCPLNLAMDRAGVVSVIDLGFGTMLLPWREAPGPRQTKEWRAHIPDEPQAFAKGKPAFVSPRVHAGQLGTRRDDLASLWISVAWALTAAEPPEAQLAWATLERAADEPPAAFAKRVGRKMRAELETPEGRKRAFGKMGPRAVAAFDVVQALKFSERPPYDHLDNMLQDAPEGGPA